MSNLSPKTFYIFLLISWMIFMTSNLEVNSVVGLALVKCL